jgi:hypothetical protein
MVLIIAIIFIALVIYAVLKERQELGCYRLSIDRQCIDENSIYLKNTKGYKTDSCQILYEKMESILSYHEKGGIWKRCLILATIITSFIYIVSNSNINKKINNNIYQYVIFLLVIFAIIYFYHNFLNYHHFRKLKQNGIEILSLIKQKC